MKLPLFFTLCLLTTVAGCATQSSTIAKFKTSDHPETEAEKQKVALYVERTGEAFDGARIAFAKKDYETALKLRKENLKISKKCLAMRGEEYV